MPPRRRKREIENYEHVDKTRENNPPVGLVNADTDVDSEPTGYEHDPHIDPELSWATKSENTSFEVPTVSLHTHERLDPRTAIKAVRKKNGNDAQKSLFHKERLPLREAIAFYKHELGWSNRMIAGDSLLVMNSLLQKESYGGKVQTIYMDPPYGIKYGSNFQPFVGQTEVTDGKDADLTGEPETLRAFRDTWELGIHSYLNYLRDRLLLARRLLKESGSIFLQIGGENVHRAAVLMDEIFGADNRMTTITFVTSGGTSAKTLPEAAHYLLWYARDKPQAKFYQLYKPLKRSAVVEFFSSYVMVELPDKTYRRPTQEERFDPDRYLPNGARLFQRMPLLSPGHSRTGRSEPYEFEGQVFECPRDKQWMVSQEGMDNLAKIGRLDGREGQSLMWKRYEDEVPGKRINNVWPTKSSASNKRFVVQVADKVIQRCILMTSDPGDLIFDPTCGSGTTAFVAEQWGRRWITCDTSRVALILAKQRLMTAVYPYYKLADSTEGISSGLEYKAVKKVSAGTLAYGKTPPATRLLDQPHVDSSKKRVSGPFTSEAVPAPVVKAVDQVTAEQEPTDEPPPPPEQKPNLADPLPPDDSIVRSGETLRQSDWREELFKTGIRGKGGQHIHFARIESLPGLRYLHADGETKVAEAPGDEPPKAALGENPELARAAEPKPPPYVSTSTRVVVSFGPDHAPLEQRQVELAIEEARSLVPTPKLIVFAAFQFDPEAAKDIDETKWPGVTLLKAQMNADLLTEDLKKKRASNNSFWLIGQPDLMVTKSTDEKKYVVSVRGFDYYNTVSGKVESGDTSKIAVWMLDPNYDGRSLFPRQVFFPASNDKHDWTRLAKVLRAEIDSDLIEAYKGTESLPFEAGEYQRVAVKIVDDRGIESLKVVKLEE